MKKGDLSKFVEDAVRWRMFDCAVQVVKERNQDISTEMLEAMIDDAVSGELAALTLVPIHFEQTKLFRNQAYKDERSLKCKLVNF